MTGFIQAVIKNPTRSLMMINKLANQATVHNQVLVLTAGVAVPAGAGATVETIVGVCNETISAAQALTQVPIIELFQNDVWLVDSANNSNAAHNGQSMVLTDSFTVNNTGTTSASGVVEQVDVFGATGDKKILVKFIA